VPPPQIKEDDEICVHCFNQMLRSRQTNVNKNRIDTLVEILQKEMLENEINIDSVLDKLDKEMDQWSLSEPVKTFYLVEVMDIIEIAAQYQTSKLETVNQIRNLLSLDFDKKTQLRDE
jgi:tRNA A37 threonylcarbamoyladenosine dehydratase